MTVFIKTRFTYNTIWFEPFGAVPPDIKFKYIKPIKEFLEQYGKIIHSTYGQEEATQKHIHIHYELKRNKKRLPKVLHQTFQYYLKSKKILQTKPPSKSSSMTVETTETESGRILQYPLKQDNLHYDLCTGYTTEELTKMHLRANAELRAHLKKKQKTEAKKDREEKTWNALCNYVDKNLPMFHQDKEMLSIEEIIQKTTVCMYYYYVEHKGCMVSRTIRDKAIRYLMTRTVLSPEELYYIYHPNYNLH